MYFFVWSNATPNEYERIIRICNRSENFRIASNHFWPTLYTYGHNTLCTFIVFVFILFFFWFWFYLFFLVFIYLFFVFSNDRSTGRVKSHRDGSNFKRLCQISIERINWMWLDERLEFVIMQIERVISRSVKKSINPTRFNCLQSDY